MKLEFEYPIEYLKMGFGIRTPVKVKLGYKNFYLYSATSPKTGKDIYSAITKC